MAEARRHEQAQLDGDLDGDNQSENSVNTAITSVSNLAIQVCRFEMYKYLGCACQGQPHKPVILLSPTLSKVIFSPKLIMLPQQTKMWAWDGNLCSRRDAAPTFVNVAMFCTSYWTGRLFSLVKHGSTVFIFIF